MTLASATNRNDYVGNGSTSVYSYTFRIISKSHLLVTTRNTSDVETTLTVDVDYTVSGVGETSGGSITLTAGNLASGYAITIRRNVSLVQGTDIRNQGDYYPETHEDEFDYLTMIDQQQQDEVNRSVKLPETISSSAFSGELPTDITDSASKALLVNSSGNGFAMGPTSDQISSAQTYATQAQTAKTGAETAQSAAETAQSAAETAQSAAETAQSAAETAATNAEGLVKISSNDTTAEQLYSKIQAGRGVKKTEISDGGNERIEIANDYQNDILLKTDNYTITTSDVGQVILLNSATAKTFTAFDISANDVLIIGNIGAGLLTFAPDGSDTSEVLKVPTNHMVTLWADTQSNKWRISNMPILPNNQFLEGLSADGSSVVDLIKVNSSNNLVIADGAQTATNAPPIDEKGVANKKFVTDQITAVAASVAAKVYLTAAQSIPSGTVTKIQFDTASYDTNSAFDIVTNHNYTVPSTGYYLISSTVSIANIADQGLITLFIYKNGAVAGQFGKESAKATNPHINIIEVLSLAANDVIDIRINQSEGANRTMQTGADVSSVAIIKIA